jgi:hypothetical protein
MTILTLNNLAKAKVAYIKAQDLIYRYKTFLPFNAEQWINSYKTFIDYSNWDYDWTGKSWKQKLEDFKNDLIRDNNNSCEGDLNYLKADDFIEKIHDDWLNNLQTRNLLKEINDYPTQKDESNSYIEKIKSRVERNSLARNNLFTCEFNSNTTKNTKNIVDLDKFNDNFWVASIDFSLYKTEVITDAYGEIPTSMVNGRSQDTNIDFEFFDNLDLSYQLFFNNWINNMCTHTTQCLFLEDYSVGITVHQLDRRLNKVVTFTFTNAFPLETNAVSYAASAGGEPTKFSVKMAYDTITITH